VKKAMNTTPSEYQEQCALIEWCELKGHPYNLIFAISNGVRTSIGAAVKAKKAGLKAGVPDLFLPHPRFSPIFGWINGLFIEMKRQTGGSASKEQIAWGYRLRNESYRVEVCKGFEAARDAIEKYLKEV